MANKLGDRKRAWLRRLINEATVDCYTEEEAEVGMAVSVQDGVVCPFKAKVIGEQVEVVELRDREFGIGVDAESRYKGKNYRIDIFSLEWPRRKPPGFEWVEAYQAFLSGGY